MKAVAIAAAITVSAAAPAQTAGTWSVKVGASRSMPKVSSDDLSAPAFPGMKTDVDSDTQPALVVGYMYTDHVSAELNLAAPYRSDLSGAGSISGTGKLGSADMLLPGVFAQYRFLDAKSLFRPYVGLGLTYAYFRKETGSGALTAITNTGSPTPTTFSLDNAFAGTLQLGVSYAINDKWFVDAAVSKTFLKTTAHFSTGQTQDLTLDPVVVNIGIGYRF
jgi:outer membrane protein